jgi:hypothetical protein
MYVCMYIKCITLVYFFSYYIIKIYFPLALNILQKHTLLEIHYILFYKQLTISLLLGIYFVLGVYYFKKKFCVAHSILKVLGSV